MSRHGYGVGAPGRGGQPSVTDQLAEAGDFAQRVTRFEAEIAALKRVLMKLKTDADLEVA